MKLAVWSPLPPATSGIADYVAEQLVALEQLASISVVVEDPAAVAASWRERFPVHAATDPPEVDLDVYHLGNSPAHAFAYRGCLKRPGVIVLHEWSLHHLVLHETVERGDTSAYLKEMRRAHGETGTFVGRQVARALGGDLLPALFPLNDRVLESCLGVVALTEWTRARAATRLPGRPTLHLPLHLALPLDPPPTRSQARHDLGLPEDALLVTAPGLATTNKSLDVALRAVMRLRERWPALRLVIAGALDPKLPLRQLAGDDPGALMITGRQSLEDFARHLAAADIVLGLRFPSHGEMSAALIRALGMGRPALVTAGSPIAAELPDGVVVKVSPGPREEAEIEALLGELCADPVLREQIGRLGKRHVEAVHDLEAGARRLSDFLELVHEQAPRTRAALGRDQTTHPLLGYFIEEVRWGARELGLPGIHLDLEPLLRELSGGEA